MNKKIGVYICSCGTNISDVIDIEEVVNFASKLENVVYAKSHKFLCSEDGKNFLTEDIKQQKPDCVVIGACTPRELENTFRKVLEQAGLNPYLFQMVNLREQVAWTTQDKTQATQKAKRYIKAAVKRVALHEPLEKKEIECNTDVVVIGAGPAGLESAISLAKADRKVYLVEKQPNIGGKAVKYEDLFPTMECAPCAVAPYLEEVLHHPNIELLTSSEVEEVVGFFGNFDVKIKKNARYVDIEKCIGCGACIEPCPVSVKSEFEYGLTDRKAIYFPVQGALPNAPVIDKENCLRFKGQDCNLCQQACPFGAINYEDKDEILEKKVGAIVVATGFEMLDPSIISNYQYKVIPEVYTSAEFERLLAATGPTGGNILTKDKKQPESIAIIHCVGSRDENYKEYCSSVCCLYATKFIHMIEKKLPEAKVYDFYVDWCLPGRDGQTFFDSVKEHAKNTSFIRIPKPNEVNISQKDGKIVIEYTDVNTNNKGQISVDMVVLCTAIVPPKDTEKIAKLLDLPIRKDGFLGAMQNALTTVSTTIEGVFIAGCIQGPKDFSSSVTQGAAASGKILSALVPGRKLELEPITAEVNEKLCGGCKVCISLCPYKAISFDEEKKVAVINEVLCKGCGTCVGACPSGAIRGKHFTTEEIFAEIEGVLSL